MLNDLLNEKPLVVAAPKKNETALEHAKAVFSGGFFGLSGENPTTQKARGIFFLQDRRDQIGNKFPGWKVPKHLLFAAGVEFDDYSFDYPVFARPCPTVPRHGFVDSVICKNGEELNNVSRQTFEVEPLAELLVTKPVDSSYNVIINGGVITFASGNDGATSGKGCNYFYISDDPIGNLISLDSYNIIAKDEVPFYEFVFDKHSTDAPVRLVQVRSAPQTPRVKDFVPAPVKVVKILKADGDLLEWESLLKTVDPTTTIIDHTNGSLSSHYAIHAIVNKIPIFTSYLPEVGSLIEPTVEDVEINEDDKDKFFKAFTLGFGALPQIFQKLKMNPTKEGHHHQMTKILILSLATLHNFSGIALSKDYEILGLVLGMFCRTALAVSAGEARHANPAAHSKFPDFYKVLPYNKGRGVCYDFLLMSDTKFCIENANTLLEIFSKITWSSGYGGKKWAKCTRSAINLFNACVNKEITQVVELFNKVLNEEHNGGKYLNKVIDVSLFDQAAQTPGTFTLNHLHTIVDYLHTAWSLKSTEIDVSLFKPVKMEAPTLLNKNGKPLFDPEIFLKSPESEDALFKHFTFQFDEQSFQIDLPVPFKSPYGYCCSSCNPPKLVRLYAGNPYWYYWKNGEQEVKVISKAKLSKMVAEVKAKHILSKTSVSDNPYCDLPILKKELQPNMEVTPETGELEKITMKLSSVVKEDEFIEDEDEGGTSFFAQSNWEDEED